MNKKAGLPLVAIRVFTAIGRYGSFTRAAAALGITQSAVSRHVATLESLAAQPLFTRKGPQVTLTPYGSQFYEAVRDAMSTIELATIQLAQGRHTHDRLTVRTSMPSFAMTVVIPVLGDFMAHHGVEVDLITSLSPPQPQEEFDVLITRDLSLPGTESWELIREELVCAGSPAMVKKHASRPLDGWPLIASRSRPDAIPTWAVAKAIPVDALHVSAVYDHLFLAVAAASGGTGLLVAPRIVIQDQLDNGILMLADDEMVGSGATYTAYVSPRSRHIEVSRAFCRWLKRMLRERSRPGTAAQS
ncbi:LysR family transcriptional regulator [Bordetella sp. N]|uniref:LysR family transcriptional regulator n=1 Tax=Bordetella sp. N TaxID=1746199 RepID=UPI00070D5267|nr:LysR family transcriptional regulator [Bordetella sp. N]ALM82252.1 LysR family transcriptional regulator [Bordetella sp. N]